MPLLQDILYLFDARIGLRINGPETKNERVRILKTIEELVKMSGGKFFWVFRDATAGDKEFVETHGIEAVSQASMDESRFW